MGYISPVEIHLNKIKEIMILYEEFYNLVVNEEISIKDSKIRELIDKISSWYNS